ncbi:MAG: PD40 domain-containing protein [Elusimicrobia bacterium]|nr:PD40 domain-containing protein [Elusimicrobiota bacterium]
MRYRRWQALGLAAAFLVCHSPPVSGFGQNQVRIRDFDWRVRSTEHFDIYYYEGSEPLVGRTAEILERAFERVTKALDVPVEPPSWASEPQKRKMRWERRPFFLFANPNDFQQSSIAFVGEGTGGITEPLKNRFMVYNDGTMQWLDEVITHEFVHIVQFHVLISGFWRSGKILKTIVYPLWMMEGMAGYLTYHIESALEELTIRDAATSQTLIPLTRLEHFGHLKPHQITLAYKQGAAALEFMGAQYGRRKVGDMLKLFESRLETSQVLAEIIGLDAFQFDAKYREYLETKYRRIVRERKLEEPGAYGAPLTATGDNIPQFNTSPVISPDGRRLYYLTTGSGHPPRLRELDLRTGRSRGIDIGYVPIENVPLGHFANLSRVLSISPDGRTLAFSGTKNHRDAIVFYDLVEGRLDRRTLDGFMTISQPQFSPDGARVVFSGMKEGFTDLYLYQRDSGRIERLTDDPHDDQMPVFTPDGQAVIYSAEILDPLSAGNYERRLYLLDLKDRSLRRIEDVGGEARDPIVSPDGRRVLFIREDGESSEICELDLESGRARRLTRSIGGTFTPAYASDGEIAFAALRRGNVHIYKGSRADFLSEELPGQAHSPTKDEKFLMPGMGSVGRSTSAVAIGPERPYRFSYSTDLFFPAFFFSSVGGFFWTSYWQGSDLTGTHKNTALVNVHSGSSFDYSATYSYSRYRPEILAGVQGIGREGLIDPDTNGNVDRAVHAQFLGAAFPLDRYHRVEGIIESATERRVESGFDGGIGHRESRAVSAAFVRDTSRGRYLVATAGNRFRLSYSQLLEVLGGSQRYNLAGVEAHQFVPIASQNTIALRAAGFQTFGPDSPQILLGGLGGVRGFARSTTRDVGSRLAVANAEWRFPVLPDLNYYMWYFFPDFYFKAIFGNLFADSGYAWTSSGQLSSLQFRDLRHSAGLGIKIYTFILQEFPLVVSMDYARRVSGRAGGVFYVYLGQLF